MRIRKAVFPVAGLGTRFLPVTKAVPKEMLPLWDRPCLEIVVAEAVAAGVEEVVFVTSRGKGAIEDYFDRSPTLEATLERTGKPELLAEVRRVARLAKVVSIRQPEPLGLGHAVACAAPAVGEEPFAVLLPDDVIFGDTPALGELIAAGADLGASTVVALKDVPRAWTRRYGICAGTDAGGGRLRVEAMVEKPAPEDAPSTLSIVGRYVLPPEIFRLLAEVRPGKGGEIQLTDALAMLAARGEVVGTPFSGAHFDTGNPLGLLEASLYAARRHPVHGEDVRALCARYAL